MVVIARPNAEVLLPAPVNIASVIIHRGSENRRHGQLRQATRIKGEGEHKARFPGNASKVRFDMYYHCDIDREQKQTRGIQNTDQTREREQCACIMCKRSCRHIMCTYLATAVC